MNRKEGYNMRYKTVEVKTRQQLDILYAEWAFTLEGFRISEIDKLIDWILQYTTFKSDIVTVYVTSGKVMNRCYRLTGDNKYPDDLNIVSIKNSAMNDVNAVAIPRFQIGARWFNDVVDNRLCKEAIGYLYREGRG